jgi:methionyl-tRNA synthetase
VLPHMSAAAAQFLGAPIRRWDDAATPLLGQRLQPYQPLATRLDPALVARLVATPEAAASPVAPTATPPGTRAAAISIEEFGRLDLRVARVTEAKRVEGSDKLLQLTLELGAEPRQVFSGIRASYEPEQLVGRLVIVVANLAPRKMRFGVSSGMVLCASGEAGGLFLLAPDSGAQPGMKVS